ncbi:MAG TPA: hypothetical protein VIZ86_16585 [Pseudomonas sp.]
MIAAAIAMGAGWASGLLVGVLLCYAGMRRTAAERPHLNPPELLAPVECPLLIEVDGRLIRAERLAHIAQRDRAMTYRTAAGETLTGRHHWTYP